MAEIFNFAHYILILYPQLEQGGILFSKETTVTQDCGNNLKSPAIISDS